MPLNDLDMTYLGRALQLAENGRGRTHPNPMVGAVIVADGQIIGEGYHTGPGHDHAEIAAMREAARGRGGPASGSGAGGASGGEVSPVEALPLCERCNGATMYVTLEPCCTYGRTPPCTNALIAAGFARVVVGAIDPSSQISGKGIDQLRSAGIQVDLADGDMALRCKRQNNGFRKWVAVGLPFVTYKYAMTLDGRVATDAGDSRWISGSDSRQLVHRMRAWSDAVMVGIGTVVADDPLLTVRDTDCGVQPLRVVVDTHLRLGRDTALVKSRGEGPILVVCGEGVSGQRRVEVESWGVETAVAAVSGWHEPTAGKWSAASSPPESVSAAAVARRESVSPAAVAGVLASRGIQSILLEGGPTLAGAWWAVGLIDQIVAFVAAKVVSGREGRSPFIGEGSESMSQAFELREVEIRSIGSDLCISGYTREAM